MMPDSCITEAKQVSQPTFIGKLEQNQFAQRKPTLLADGLQFVAIHHKTEFGQR